MAANNDTIKKTVTVSVVLCVICSVVVSAAAVLLKPTQQFNKALEKKVNILAAAGLTPAAGQKVDELYQQMIKPMVVDLETGKFTDAVSPDSYDQYKAAKDPQTSKALPGEADIASIKRMPQYATVYVVEKDGQLDKLVLPVHGYGLWSTLYGFVALQPDLNTVSGMGFYQHGETPGLGGEVDNPAWKALWPGKKIYAEGAEQPSIELIKGKVDSQSPQAAYQVDGLSGATLTSNGVTNLMKFWFGQNGFGPFLKNLRAGEA
ncbi:Na(+)-translocating NADH-quinone reductase subunit C [Balneatrix alpica]|uniref:Na(+)-translocating NADH-quinone reductase subunit C n=1 Tax=Balneatrix alpica TaxID=75684 RepID=A0ABV5Z8N5_9GAMM|nr:Na(+)-translocating NADH-quinone reductase subunit C [Balneatrix alpica]